MTLALTDYRATHLRIASMFFVQKKSTADIARIMGLSEAFVWNNFDLAKAVWNG